MKVLTRQIVRGETKTHVGGACVCAHTTCCQTHQPC